MHRTPTVKQETRVGRLGVPRRGAFTLVELMVVVAIILVLAGIAVVWVASAIAGFKVRRVQAGMSNALSISDLLADKSVVAPDHRLANFYWVQPHTSLTPVWGGGGRQMSSTEFFVFLAYGTQPMGKMLESQGALLKPTGIASADAPPELPLMVDVFEQNPSQTNLLYKAHCPTSDVNTGVPVVGLPEYALVSSPSGYPLRSLFDAWDHELVYRLRTSRSDLNGEDPADAGSQKYTSRHDAEVVAHDEAMAAANGMGPVAPAVAAYGHAMFMSAGPDGKWGGFTFCLPGTSFFRRDATADKKVERDADARDNLYSAEANQ